RCLDSPCEGEDVAFDLAAARQAVNGRAWGDHRSCRIRRGWRNLSRAHRVVRRAGVKKGRVRQVAQEEVLGKGVIENAEPAANDRLAPTEYVPGNAGAGREVLIVGLIQS